MLQVEVSCEVGCNELRGQSSRLRILQEYNMKCDAHVVKFGIMS